jgi:hypothetical protein
MGYTYEQLQQMGATPVEPTSAPTTKKKYTYEELQQMGAQPVTQKEDGFLKSVAKEVATPVARLGVNAYNAAQGVTALTKGQPFTAEQAAQPRTLPFLGEVKPVGQEGTFPEKIKDTVSNAAQLASNIVPASKIGAVIKPGLKGLVGATAKAGAKTGLAGGSLYGFGKGLEDPNATVGSVASETALGGAFGAFGGGALSGAGAVLPKIGRGIKNVINKDVQTLRTEKIQEGLLEQNRLKTVAKAYNKNTIIRKGEDGVEQKITPIDTFGKYNISPDVESGVIKMGDYATGQGQLGKIKQVVSDLDTEIDTKLVNTGVKTPIEQLRKQAIAQVQADNEIRQAGKVAETVSKVNKRFDDYVDSYGTDLDIAEINNIRKVANKDFKEDTMDVSRIVGDVSRDIVYNYSGDPAIKKLLQEQGELLAARKYAEILNGTSVIGGRFGNYAMRGIGALVGTTVSGLPVAGPLIGVAGGEIAARALQKAQFKSVPAEIKALLQRSKTTDVTQSANKIPKMDSNIINNGTSKAENVNELIQKFTRNRKLSPVDLKVQEASIRKYITNKENLLQEYQNTFGSKVINTDLARRLFKDIGYNGKNSEAVHEAASALAKDAWKIALKNPQKDVILYAGSSGSGKSSSVGKLMPNIENDVAAVLDGNLSKYESAVTKIEEAAKAGKDAKIIYVYRDPVDAWKNGVIKRMKMNKEEGGRVVPLSVFLENAPGSLNTIRKLKQMDIPVSVVDNSLGQGNARLMSDSKFAKLKYPDNLKDILEEETRKLLESGVINKKEYEKLIR